MPISTNGKREISCAVAVADAVRDPATVRRRLGGGQELTPGGSYTSFRSSI